MRIGIVGPRRSVDKIEAIVLQSFENVAVEKLIYDDYTQAPALIKKKQHLVNAILFSGKTPYVYSSPHKESDKIWDYIPRHGSSLLTALFRASSMYGYDISNVSFDSYKYDVLEEIFEEIGYEKKDLNLYLAEDRILKDDYLEYLFDFHKDLYGKGKVSCCVTALGNVYDQLVENGIPCIKISHTTNIIRESVNRVLLKHKLLLTQNERIVVLSIKQDDADEYAVLDRDEYSLVNRRMAVEEQVYLFARRIRAAVMKAYEDHYILVSTRQMLETETKGLKQFSLMREVKNHSDTSVSIGIGFGDSAADAKSNALKAMNKALKTGGDKAIVVHNNQVWISPSSSESEDKSQILDERLYHIAQASGIGINSIYRIDTIIKSNKIDKTTPAEIAALYGIKLRSMNRILVKLEQSGYLEVIGKKKLSSQGRPSRIIRFKLW